MTGTAGSLVSIVWQAPDVGVTNFGACVCDDRIPADGETPTPR